MRMLHVIEAVLFFYLFFRLVLLLPARRPFKAAAAFVLLLATQQHLLTRLFFGSLASPDLPRPVLMTQSLLLVSCLLLFLTILLRDAALLVRGVLRRVRRRLGGGGLPESDVCPGDKRSDAPSGSGFSQGRRFFLLSCPAVLAAVYGLRRAVEVPRVRETQCLLPGLPAELDGLRIAHVSDLHIGPLLLRPWTEAVVDAVNALKPDLVVLTGDIVDGLPAQRAESVAPLRQLRARCGVFACAGNHEYYSDFRAWMRAFSSLGTDMLLNEGRVLNIGGRQLYLAGVTDIAAARFSLPQPDCAAAAGGAPQTAVRVLLAHRPITAAAAAAAGFDLQLSGHTHGGQILGLQRIVAEFNAGYLYGWYAIRGMRLYVSSGAGLWNGFPVRLGVPSEIAHITLRRA
ncbi:MAG: metallophosphoesterase [Desulfovibrio sp.]|jgi:predicted MPP superfamily phosphohydrolase|nr:metallophosphoesterase [Desulfovibrio sp.]